MIIIFAEKVDLDRVNNLVAQFDKTSHPDQQSRILTELDNILGPRVRAKLRIKLKPFALSPGEIDNLAQEALDQALRGVGRVRYTRSHIQAEELARQMATSPKGQKLFELLSPELRQQLQAPYLKQNVENLLSRELSALLDRPDLPELLGISGATSSASAIERTEDNARMLASAFPGAIEQIQKPPAHLLGYLEKDVLRTLVARETRERGQISPETMRVWRSIQPVVEALRNQSGGARLSVDQVVSAYRQSLDRYEPAIAWWEEQLRLVGRPFRLKDPRTYADAREILEENGYDPSLWASEQSPYYISKEALKPFGRKAIEQVLAIPGLAAPRSTSPRPPLEQAPAPSAPPTEPQAPSWAMEMGQQGRGGELYRAIVMALYPDPRSVERKLGEFIAEHPNPSEFEVKSLLDDLAAQDPEASEYLRSAWRETVRQIDRRVTETLRDPWTVGSIAEQFGFSPIEVGALREHIRRVVFGRTNRLLLIAS